MQNKSVVATADKAASSLRSGRLNLAVPHFERCAEMGDRTDALVVRIHGGRKTCTLALGGRLEAMLRSEGRGALGSEPGHAERAGVLDRSATVRVTEIRGRSTARRGFPLAANVSPRRRNSQRFDSLSTGRSAGIPRMLHEGSPMHNKPCVATGDHVLLEFGD